MNNTRRTIAVVGAGVIGQVYAGRLAKAGCDVWLFARGSTYARLRQDGVCLRENGVDAHPPVRVVDTAADIPVVDTAFLAVRTDQVAAALPLLAAVRTQVVVTLVNLTDDTRAVATQIGMDRPCVERISMRVSPVCSRRWSRRDSGHLCRGGDRIRRGL